MSLKLVCPGCQIAFYVGLDAAGEYVRCPGGHILAVPKVDLSLPVPAEADPPTGATAADDFTIEAGDPPSRRPAGLTLILALLGLFVLAALGACLYLLFGEISADRQRPTPALAGGQTKAQVPTAPARSEPRDPKVPERPQDNVPPPPDEVKPPPPPEPAPAVVAKKAPVEREVPKERAEPPADTAGPLRDAEPALPKFMMGRIDRLDRNKLDFRSSSKPEGPPPPVWDGHTNHVRRVAFTEDGRFVISVSGDLGRDEERPPDNSIRVWDARTGKQVHKVDGFPEPLDGLCLSPGGRFALFSYTGYWQGKTFVRAKEHGVFLWDVQSKRVVGPGPDTTRTFSAGPAAGGPKPRFAGLKGEVWSSAFSPDLKTVVAGDTTSSVTLWETGTGRRIGQREIPTIPGRFTGARWVEFTPDGKQLVVVGSDRVMRLCQPDGKVVSRLPDSHLDTIWALDVASAEDGSVRALTAGGGRFREDQTGYGPGKRDYAIRLWDLNRGQVIRRFEGHEGPVSSVAFCPDGRHFVSGGEDRTVRLWDLETGQQVRVLGRLERMVLSVAVSPDGRSCISGGTDCKIRFWQLPAE